MLTMSALLVLPAIAAAYSISPAAAAQQQTARADTASPQHRTAFRRHRATRWHVAPSFLLDTLCLLNVLTGDPYYRDFYPDEYARFEPKLTPEVRTALAHLKFKIKDEGRMIPSAFLTLWISATDDHTLDDLLRTLDDPGGMQKAMRKTPYYSESGRRMFDSVREDLRAIVLFLKDIRFEEDWKQRILPGIQRRIAEIDADLPRYNVIAEVEARLGFRLPSDALTVYLLHYSKPHGIRITGMRFLTNADYPFSIVLRNAVHETMHPPYRLGKDPELRKALESLRGDAFLMEKVKHHNPAFGYNSFEGYIEEDCVQALEQNIDTKLGVAVDPRKRWKESDDGMHVFAAALYNAMNAESFDGTKESFRSFLIRSIRSGPLRPGRIQAAYEASAAPASP